MHIIWHGAVVLGIQHFGSVLASDFGASSSATV